MLKKIFRLVAFLIVITCSKTLYAQQGAPSCAELEANFQQYQSCATNVPFQNSTGNTTNEHMNTHTSCIPTNFHGPTWFFMKIQTTGSITLQISQVDNNGFGTDVDFALWGPFTGMENICSLLEVPTEVDCSYSDSAIENVHIPNATQGEYYVLLVDNYDNLPGQITIAQTAGTGSSDCGFLSSVQIKDTAGNEIDVTDYCKPATKDIMAKVDTNDFPGNPGDLRFNYKWYKDGLLISDLPAQTTSTSTITVSDTGLYKVELTAYDSTDPTVDQSQLTVSSDEIQLNFYNTPDATLDPVASNCIGNNPVLHLTNTTTPTFNNYQWYENGNPISGQTSASFTPIEGGTYLVKVSNPGCGSVDSPSVTIYNGLQATIASDQTICADGSYQITSAIVNAIDPATLQYQWKKDGVNIPGANAQTFTVNTTVQTAGTTSQYTLAVSEQGQCGATSNAVSITINQNPTLNTNPVVLQQCDYISPNTDGIAEINLTQVYAALTNGDNQLQLQYYTDAALTQQIAAPENFTNTTPFNQTIYVNGRYPNQVPQCASSTGTIQLTIDPTTISDYPDMAPVCPILNTTSGTVNLDAERILIKNTYYPATNVDIVFYRNQSDASLEQNPLDNTSLFTTGNSTVYTRIETNNNCQGIGTFTVTVDVAPIQTVITPLNACKSENILLSSKDAEALSGQNPTVQASYFLSFDNAKNNVSAINKNAPANFVIGITPVFTRLYDSATQCFSVTDFTVNIYPNPIIFQPDPMTVCGTGTAVFNLNLRTAQITGGNAAYQVSFYESAADLANNNPIAAPDTYVSGPKTLTVNVVDTANNNCASVTNLVLDVTESPGNQNNPQALEVCDDSGFHSFDLTERQNPMAGSTPVNQIEFRYYENENDAQANNNNTIADPEAFTNTTANYQKIYVRINSKIHFDSESAIACYRILEQELFVHPFPVDHLSKSSYKICVDIDGHVVNKAFVDALLPDSDYDFIWYNGPDAVAANQIIGASGHIFETSAPGDYSVKIVDITNNALCSTVGNFTVENSDIPFSVKSDPAELIAFEVDNTITAIVTPPSGDFEYELNDIGWQDSNIFYNVKEGIYELKVRNKHGCGEISTDLVVVDFPKYFTPNADGFHDNWNIGGRPGLDISHVYIFDREGKLVKEIFADETGWDGTLNGRPLPADDYWFKIVYVKNGVTKEFMSHFALKR